MNRFYRYRALIIACIVLALIVLMFSTQKGKHFLTGHPEIFSKSNMLESLWYHYKKEYLEESTLRVLDKERNNVTTSEGESYAMLRAVWMNDKATFDTSWQWTKDNLQHDNDHLLSWLFGEHNDGSYGVLTDQGGEHSASDADTDTALALIFAADRWNDSKYMGDALPLIHDIWEKEVVVINDKPYMSASNVEKGSSKTSFVINPSYLAPYAYRIFAKVDPSHDWLGLVETSYEVLYANLDSTLDTGASAHLPSDWLVIDARTGTLSKATSSSGYSTDFSYDALRTPWRVGLDYEWFKEPRAAEVLSRMNFLITEYERNGKLARHYTHGGQVVEPEESPAMYGGTVAVFSLASPTLGKELYLNKLESLYNPDTFDWNSRLGYYDSNWAWFGLALYNHRLPNLSTR